MHAPHPTEAPITEPRFYTPAQFHDHFKPHVGRDTIYRLINDGRIKAVKLYDRKLLIPASEIHDWPQREMDRSE